jgi:hypothetical protein
VFTAQDVYPHYVKLYKPIKARYFRINVLSHETAVCMKLEMYGCIEEHNQGGTQMYLVH